MNTCMYNVETWDSKDTWLQSCTSLFTATVMVLNTKLDGKLMFLQPPHNYVIITRKFMKPHIILQVFVMLHC